MIDERWLAARLADGTHSGEGSPQSDALWELLTARAAGFASVRTGVVSATVRRPRRGLRHDEAASFLRAVDAGVAVVDDAGYVTLPGVRQKTPVGRYALFSKDGPGVSVNLEYLIQIGATAELILDQGWSAQDVDFERGEFDALGYDAHGGVILAMEAKARPTGPDSLETLVRAWLSFAEDPTLDLASNAGRKWRELTRLCSGGPVAVWLVADGARWDLTAHISPRGGVELTPGTGPSRERIPTNLEESMLVTVPYDPPFHRPGSLAAEGGCSWHGRTCSQQPIISFRDAQGSRQSGCARAAQELAERSEIERLEES
jgi:hypothetical protein